MPDDDEMMVMFAAAALTGLITFGMNRNTAVKEAWAYAKDMVDARQDMLDGEQGDEKSHD